MDNFLHKKVKLFLLTVPMLFFLAFSASGQQVSGTVVDGETSETLPGVNILVKGTATGTSTNAEGAYQVNVTSMSDTLIFSFVGYETREVPINGRNQIDVQLMPQALSGEELVVVGYGTQRKVDLTGSVSIADADELKKSSQTSIAGALQGQAAGVSVQSSGAPGETPEVRIRGVGSFGSNEPLYIVDGVPVENIKDFNAEDIESIQVLKDAASAAVYGTRAANGVVIISTKDGRSGDVQIDYNGSVGVSNIYQRLDVMEREDFQMLQNESLNNRNIPLAPGNDPNSPQFIDDINTDWQDAALEPGFMTEHNLTISGGNETSTYSISGGLQNQEGHMVGHAPAYDRYNARIKSNHQFGKLTVGENLFLTHSKQWWQESRHEVSLINNMLKSPPIIPVRDEDRLGGYGGADANIEKAITLNVIGTNKMLEHPVETNRILANLWGEYEIIDGLVFRTNLSYDSRTTLDRFFIPTYDMGFFFTEQVGMLDETRGELTQTLIENTLTYQTTIGRHDFNLLAGYTEERGYYDQVHGHAEGYSRPFFKTIDAGNTGKTTTGFQTLNTLRSFLGRVQYNFDDRYLMTATVRRDGSSRFGDGNRYGVFPSASVGWRISNESFFNVSWIDDLKLRASYGELGRQNIGNFATAAFINTFANYNFNDQVADGAIQVELANENIKWETSVTRGIGLDATLFENRLDVTVDYYNNESSDILLGVPIPGSLGASNNPTVNAASISNKGWEFDVSYRNNMGDLNYTISGNLGTVNNEVLSLGNGEPIFGAASLTEVGSEVGELYGYVADGIFQNWDEVYSHAQQNQDDLERRNDVAAANFTAPGDIRFKDLNGDGIINADGDRRHLGSAIPDFTYGFNLSLNYQGWDLSAFFQGNYGNKIYNQQRVVMENMADYNNRTQRMINRWTSDNQHNNIELPRAIFEDPNNNNRASQRYVEDGSFMRLQNLTVGYSLPSDLLSRVGVSSLRIFAQGQNLFTLTGYSGLDPMLGDDGDEVDNDGLFSRGFDAGGWPHPRIFQAGIELSL